jgi:hypothetical protein
MTNKTDALIATLQQRHVNEITGLGRDPEKYISIFGQAISALQASEAENKRLREALKPFADHSDRLHTGFDDSMSAGFSPMVPVFVKHLRVASLALKEASHDDA